MRPTQVTLKRLFALSGNRCAFPKCQTPLVQEGGSVVGEVCHIRAESPGGPRYDPGQTDEERDGFDNLTLMCAVHHKVIDDDELSYSVARLEEIKRAHEEHTRRSGEPPAATVDRFVAAVIGSTIYGNVTINQGVAAVTHLGPQLAVGFASSFDVPLAATTTLMPISFTSGGAFVVPEDAVRIRTDNTGDRSARDVVWTYRFPSGIWIYSGPDYDSSTSLQRNWMGRPTVTTKTPLLHPGAAMIHTTRFRLADDLRETPIEVSVAATDMTPVRATLVARLDAFVADVLARRGQSTQE